MKGFLSKSLLGMLLTVPVALTGKESEHILAKRVHAHLLIHDYESACQEASAALNKYPQDKELREYYIKAAAAHGDEKQMIEAWNAYARLFPDAYKNHVLLEAMAWGIIEKGSASTSPIIRTIAVQGAFFGADAKGVTILHRHLSDTNSFVRWASVQLSSRLHDAKLCDAMYDVLANEKVTKVRLEAIRAVGSMNLKKALPSLMALATSDQSTAEEKLIAIESIIEMLDNVNESQVHGLAQSDRAGMRLIACRLIEQYEMPGALSDLSTLLQDQCGDVRAAALHALGILRISLPQQVQNRVVALLQDSDPNTAIMAAWVLILQNSPQGEAAIQRWIAHERQDIRLMAAGALAASGKYGAPLAEKIFRTTTDPYVRINLAMGLIGQRIAIQNACDILCNSLQRTSERWMWKETDMFKLIAPSDIRHDDSIPQYPEAVDQLVRLEVLNTIAMMRHPHAQKAVEHILKQKMWGVTGVASALLLTECDEEALELVKVLLHAPEYKVRTQAALILAQWGRDEEAIATLQQAYTTAERQMKEKILEGIGRIGAPESIPFLVAALGESSQSLRIIAASALLQALYH